MLPRPGCCTLQPQLCPQLGIMPNYFKRFLLLGQFALKATPVSSGDDMPAPTVENITMRRGFARFQAATASCP
jgi:hypothetical protein